MRKENLGLTESPIIESIVCRNYKLTRSSRCGEGRKEEK